MLSSSSSEAQKLQTNVQRDRANLRWPCNLFVSIPSAETYSRMFCCFWANTALHHARQVILDTTKHAYN